MFNPKNIKSFHFVSCEFNETNAEAYFCYAFDNGIEFIEILKFHGAKLPLNQNQRLALNLCLKHLYLVLGISYYKAAVPLKIIINNFKLNKQQADFYNNLYKKGLGEFAYKNQLDLRRRINFPYVSNIQAAPSKLKLSRCTAIPIGGGKDSIVTIEMLQSANEPIQLFSLGDFKVTSNVAKVANLPCRIVERALSPKLLELNEQGALNGHVPISAIIAFILPVAAILYGFDRAALSNERSANTGNLILNGEEINHQYSKSFEFEQKVSRFIQENILSNFIYFSLLRPLSDLHIARLFSKLTPYHLVFMSCNAAFKLQKKNRKPSWCLHCPKCRFTFLALAPFMDKEKLIAIFGKNLLNDKDQQQGYDELIGIKGHRPFECVGEIEESKAAFILLSKNPKWQNDLLVQRFIDLSLPYIENPDAVTRSVFEISNAHLIPNDYLSVFLNN